MSKQAISKAIKHPKATKPTKAVKHPTSPQGITSEEQEKDYGNPAYPAIEKFGGMFSGPRDLSTPQTMKHPIITGQIFEYILTKSGYNRADFARFVSEHDQKRSRQWASTLIRKYRDREMPSRWVKHLRNMVGEEDFVRLYHTQVAAGKSGNSRVKYYSITEYAAMYKAGMLPEIDIDQAIQNIRSVLTPSDVSEEEFIRQIIEMS